MIMMEMKKFQKEPFGVAQLILQPATIRYGTIVYLLLQLSRWTQNHHPVELNSIFEAKFTGVRKSATEIIREWWCALLGLFWIFSENLPWKFQLTSKIVVMNCHS